MRLGERTRFYPLFDNLRAKIQLGGRIYTCAHVNFMRCSASASCACPTTARKSDEWWSLVASLGETRLAHSILPTFRQPAREIPARRTTIRVSVYVSLYGIHENFDGRIVRLPAFSRKIGRLMVDGGNFG